MSIFEETVSIVAREPDANRSLLSAVNSVYVPTDFGGFVPVSQIAKVVPSILGCAVNVGDLY